MGPRRFKRRGAAEIVSVTVRREEGLRVLRGSKSATRQCPARYPAADAHISAKRVFDDKGLVRFFFSFSKPCIVSRIRHICRMSYRMRICGRQTTVSSNPG